MTFVALDDAPRMRGAERETGRRLEQFLGERLWTSDGKADPGWDYIKFQDDGSPVLYDAIGPPSHLVERWRKDPAMVRMFIRSIEHHLLESDNINVIDLTGFNPNHHSQIRDHLATLPASIRKTIITIGF